MSFMCQHCERCKGHDVIFIVDILIAVVLFVGKVSCGDVNFGSGHTEDEYTEEGHFIRAYAGLTEVPTDIPSGAKRVSLYVNRITTVRKNAFSELSECTELYLNENELNEIEAGAFSGLVNLEILYLDNNDLKEIRPDMWIGLSSLKQLSIAINEVEDLPPRAFMGLTKLEELTLNYNDLTRVRGETFEGMFALKVLYLYDNDIASLGPGAFMNLPHLYWLLLGSNNLETVEMRSFMDPSCPDEHPTDLAALLESNPLQCDERLCWLKEAESKNWITPDILQFAPVTCVNYPGETYWKDVNLNCS